MECVVCKKQMADFEGHEKYFIKCKPCFDEHEVLIGNGYEEEITFVGYPKGDSETLTK